MNFLTILGSIFLTIIGIYLLRFAAGLTLLYAFNQQKTMIFMAILTFIAGCSAIAFMIYLLPFKIIMIG